MTDTADQGDHNRFPVLSEEQKIGRVKSNCTHVSIICHYEDSLC